MFMTGCLKASDAFRRVSYSASTVDVSQMVWTAAMTRDELVQILTEIVQATRARLLECRTADGLKAAEMLAKMCGWNQPEKVSVHSVELRVDAALIEQLRIGYAEMSATRMGEPKQLAAVAKPMEPLSGPKPT
jgi:hypothetical protein